MDRITSQDAKYPQLLKRLGHTPDLFCLGNINLLNEKLIAIVGTREPNTYGKITAKMIAQSFLKMGYTTVSGLALGIDTVVHETTLSKTIAVLGTPLSQIYPNENKELANKIIASGGLLLSQYDTKSNNKFRFIERDYLQARISSGVCAIQGGKESGTKYACQEALKIGRMLIVPCPIEKDAEKKPELYGLIYHFAYEGAMVIEKPEDYKDIEIMLDMTYRVKV